MADVSVRPARRDDVPEIARVQVDTWRTCYPAILPAAVLETLSVELAHAAWQQAIEAPPSRQHHVLVAQEKTALVGFVALGPADDLEADDPDPLPPSQSHRCSSSRAGAGAGTGRGCSLPRSSTPAPTG